MCIQTLEIEEISLYVVLLHFYDILKNVINMFLAIFIFNSIILQTRCVTDIIYRRQFRGY